MSRILQDGLLSNLSVRGSIASSTVQTQKLKAGHVQACEIDVDCIRAKQLHVENGQNGNCDCVSTRQLETSVIQPFDSRHETCTDTVVFPRIELSGRNPLFVSLQTTDGSDNNNQTNVALVQPTKVALTSSSDQVAFLSTDPTSPFLVMSEQPQVALTSVTNPTDALISNRIGSIELGYPRPPFPPAPVPNVIANGVYQAHRVALDSFETNLLPEPASTVIRADRSTMTSHSISIPLDDTKITINQDGVLHHGLKRLTRFLGANAFNNPGHEFMVDTNVESGALFFVETDNIQSILGDIEVSINIGPLHRRGTIIGIQRVGNNNVKIRVNFTGTVGLTGIALFIDAITSVVTGQHFDHVPSIVDDNSIVGKNSGRNGDYLSFIYFLEANSYHTLGSLGFVPQP